jgi:hypothetical protein
MRAFLFYEFFKDAIYDMYYDNSINTDSDRKGIVGKQFKPNQFKHIMSLVLNS